MRYARTAIVSTIAFALVGLIMISQRSGPTLPDDGPVLTSAVATVSAGPSLARQGAWALAQASAPEEAQASDADKAPSKKKKKRDMGAYLLEKLLPVLGLLLIVAFVFWRLPKIELGHSKAFLKRRVQNWLPLGMTYAFLYMGRYNLNPALDVIGDVRDFSIIFTAGTVTYGISFLVNGPLTDKFGGKFAILLGAGGSLVANVLMGILVLSGKSSTLLLSILYAANMYFQSFGAVAIVKVNAPWFHVNERGVFGAIFGILISLGVYFAYDWSRIILDYLPVQWVFFIPALLLAVLWCIDVAVVKNTPGEAGLTDFDTADASSGDDGPRKSAFEVFKMMATNRVIVIIALVEFCSGFMRQAVMQYYPKFRVATGPLDDFVLANWGLLLCGAGILGGIFAGVISDRVFQSRRGPVAAVLYGFMAIGALMSLFLLGGPAIGWVAVFMSLSVIGVHGMLSGTASMDFGGKRNVGVAVGMIDGMVYLGTGSMALLYSNILPTGAAKADPANWDVWPISMIPVAIIGFILATRVWNAKPKGKAAAH